MREPIIFPDVELWLAGWLRAQLPGGTFVGNRLPRDSAATRHAVIIRDDSGPDGQFTATRMVGIRHLCPADRDDNGHLARIIAAVLRTSAGVDTPVAAVGPVRGPYRVPAEGDRPERYLTVELTIVGQSYNKEGT